MADTAPDEAEHGAGAVGRDHDEPSVLRRVDKSDGAPELEAIVRRALAPEPGDRYPSGGAMAAALESAVMAVDTSSPTVVVPIPVASAGVAAAAATVADAGTPGAPGAADLPAAPLTPPAPSAAQQSYQQAPSRVVRGGRRGGPATARIVGLGIALIVGGLLTGGMIGALPALGDGDTALRTEPPPSTTPTADPTPEPIETPAPTPEPTPTPDPTPVVTPLPDGEVGDLCEPFLDIACGLGAGAYQPSRFDPPVRFTLGEGWGTALHDGNLVALQRDEGYLTFASRLRAVYPDGQVIEPRDRARDLIEAFIATDGVGASAVADVRIGGRKGLSVDLTPTGSERIELFATASATFFLEADATTRVVVVDVKATAVVIVIEPTGRATLDDILATADDVAGTIIWP